MKKIALALALGTMMASAAAPAFADYTLNILHFNDMHSRFEPVSKYDSDCSAGDNAAGKCFGGAARLKTFIETRRSAIEAAGGNVVTLVGGDQFQGSLYFTTYKGKLNAEVLNTMGIDAMAVGNHEFDNGPAGLSNFADLVNFPVMFANGDLSGEPLLDGKIPPYTILEVGGEKLGVIGLLTPDTVDIASPGDTVKIFTEDYQLPELISKLNGDGVNKIILLTHIGISSDIELATSISGIDVIVGGHSHTLLEDYPTVVEGPDGNEVQIVQANAYTKYVGELSVTFDDEGNVKDAGGQAWSLDARVAEDKDILAKIAEAAGPLEELKNTIVGETTGAIEGNRSFCRAETCEMGVLVAEAMLDRVKNQGVTIAIQNGGGLRASIDAGEITMGEVLTVLPFQNTLATFELKGSDVIAALENGVSQVETGAGRFPQIAGLKFSYKPSAEPGSRIVSVEVLGDEGTFGALDPAATYGVVSNNYMRNGGDGYKVFSTNGMKAYDFGPNLEDVVADYISAGGAYTPMVDDRITAVE
ncbi:bifunctional metallophosphatase/5'-nucleotidase [Maritalea sp.]|jgi:5'-nucleotidase|uniref:bifunctional metallophosphatase/5'-nucleotidase n=1 Tax=Maritalea sp. TaxID=2003361 RepID=UPI0039E44098